MLIKTLFSIKKITRKSNIEKTISGKKNSHLGSKNVNEFLNSCDTAPLREDNVILPSV